MFCASAVRPAPPVVNGLGTVIVAVVTVEPLGSTRLIVNVLLATGVALNVNRCTSLLIEMGGDSSRLARLPPLMAISKTPGAGEVTTADPPRLLLLVKAVAAFWMLASSVAGSVL